MAMQDSRPLIVDKIFQWHGQNIEEASELADRIVPVAIINATSRMQVPVHPKM